MLVQFVSFVGTGRQLCWYRSSAALSLCSVRKALDKLQVKWLMHSEDLECWFNVLPFVLCGQAQFNNVYQSLAAVL